jgi:hypothetical protein
MREPCRVKVVAFLFAHKIIWQRPSNAQIFITVQIKQHSSKFWILYQGYQYRTTMLSLGLKRIKRLMKIIVVYVSSIGIPSFSVAAIGKPVIRVDYVIQFGTDNLAGHTVRQIVVQVFDLIAITTFSLRPLMLILPEQIDLGHAKNIVKNITLTCKIHAYIYCWSG